MTDILLGQGLANPNDIFLTDTTATYMPAAANDQDVLCRPQFPVENCTFIQGTNPNLMVPPSAMRFAQAADWPNAKLLRRLSDPSWVNASRDLTPPFFQNDWPNPKGFATKDGAWINPGIQQVTAQDPFRQTDWPNPQPPVAPNVSFTFTKQLVPDTTTYMPAAAVDWPIIKPRPTPLLSWVNGLPPVQYIFRQPLVSVPKPPTPPVGGRDFVQPLNLLIATTAPQIPPIRIYDWPNPAARPRPVALRDFIGGSPILFPPPPPAGDELHFLPFFATMGQLKSF